MKPRGKSIGALRYNIKTECPRKPDRVAVQPEVSSLIRLDRQRLQPALDDAGDGVVFFSSIIMWPLPWLLRSG
jgi:hypothetical protein